MNPTLKVVLNGQTVLEFHRTRAIPAHQRRDLAAMDRRMDKGIELDGTRLADPNAMQRAEFVSRQLVNALRADDDAQAAATCTYLADRIPSLKEIHIIENGEYVSTELVVTDEQVKNSIPVTFQ